MAWTSASIGIFEPLPDIESAISGYRAIRIEQGNGEEFELKSAIQIVPTELVLYDNTPVILAMVIDECIGQARRLVRDEVEDTYRVVDKVAYLDVRWSYVRIPTRRHKLIFARTKETRSFAFRVISEALASRPDYVKPIGIDIQRVARDHYGHWLGGIEREGNWQRGTLYGDMLEQDNVVGPEYVRCTKNQVGIVTNYFGSPVKVRLTNDGTIMAMADFSEQMGRFVQFIIDEIEPYII